MSRHNDESSPPRARTNKRRLSSGGVRGTGSLIRSPSSRIRDCVFADSDSFSARFSAAYVCVRPSLLFLTELAESSGQENLINHRISSIQPHLRAGPGWRSLATSLSDAIVLVISMPAWSHRREQMASQADGPFGLGKIAPCLGCCLLRSPPSTLRGLSPKSRRSASPKQDSQCYRSNGLRYGHGQTGRR